MIVNIINQQSSLVILPDLVQKIVEQVIVDENQNCEETSIYFVDTPTISRLHEEYFQDPSPTDCISFPLDEEEDGSPYRVLGDVFVHPESAIAFATEKALNPYEETTLYIVHGLLHLLGYNDIEDEDRNEMRAAENRHMEKLKELNLVLHP